MFDFFINVMAFFVSLIPHWTVVVDTETTDKDPTSAELLQVALVSGSGRVLFNKYIKPDSITQWPGAQKVNHISPGMVKHCRDIYPYVPLINAYLKHTRKIVGYNITEYDLPILNKYGISTSAEQVDIMKDDANKRTKLGERQARWRKLTSTARHYGYLFIAHDAVEDCLATLHVHCFMHPGVQTIFYVLRKVVRVIIGALLIGWCCKNPIALFEKTISINVLPYISIGCWSYLYGPIIGVLATFAGVIAFAGGSIPLISVLFTSVFLGIFYGIARSPKPWIIRIILCLVFTIAGSLIAFRILPEVLFKLFEIQIYSGGDFIWIMIAFLCGLPIYFFANSFLKKIL